MITLGHLQIPVFQPFPQLSGPANLVRRQAPARGGPSLLQIGIDIELARGLDGAGEQVAQNLLIHRGADHERRAERMQVFGRERGRGPSSRENTCRRP